ncbi:MAG: prepilin peptidase [Elusimicrobia bacterium]|nr:prepilin peptidase [Elusimicrobiota bacterium]
MIFVVFLLGLMFGSFANVLIYRLPNNISPVFPRSFCPNCRQPIKWFDNIPVLSFLLLKGKCRRCGALISIRYPLVELAVAIGFSAIFYFYGVSEKFLTISILFFYAVAISGIDIEYRIIPDELNITLFIFGVFLPKSFQNGYLRGVFLSAGAGLAAGAVLFLLAVFFSKIFRQEAMGMGDVKLITALASFTGFSSIFWLIFLSSVFGSIVGIAVKLIKRQKGFTQIAFGPYLCLAAIFYEIFSNKLPHLFS